jgi:hypothetical protein
MSTRRGSTRREVTIPCQAVREHDFVLVADRTLDVSVEGMLLPMNRRLLTGETLIVSFAIPGTWIDAEAIVTRVVHGRRPGDDGVAVGVMFDVMSLHGRPPPLPRRGPMARLRRGLEPPQLADHALMMQTGLSSPPAELYASEVDVEAAAEDGEAFDPLGILREVAHAWRRLAFGGIA